MKLACTSVLPQQPCQKSSFYLLPPTPVRRHGEFCFGVEPLDSVRRTLPCFNQTLLFNPSENTKTGGRRQEFSPDYSRDHGFAARTSSHNSQQQTTMAMERSLRFQERDGSLAALRLDSEPTFGHPTTTATICGTYKRCAQAHVSNTNGTASCQTHARNQSINQSRACSDITAPTT